MIQGSKKGFIKGDDVVIEDPREKLHRWNNQMPVAQLDHELITALPDNPRALSCGQWLWVSRSPRAHADARRTSQRLIHQACPHECAAPSPGTD